MNRRVFLAAAAFALPVTGQARDKDVLRGRVADEAGAAAEGNAPLAFLTSDGVERTVKGDEFTMAQLHDQRLAGRLWELEGTTEPASVFQIHKLFTIKDGKRHVVKYYCEVCHIYTHAPGRCMCCQDDTELQEHPVD